MTASDTPLLRVRGLGKTFPVRKGFATHQLRALADVSFDLAAGEVVALVGESGSGKSTTARLIARLMEPSTGEILLDGTNVLAAEPRGASLDYRAKVQMIFQDPFGSLNPVHTVGYHLERPLKRHGRASHGDVVPRVHALLEKVGLTPPAMFAAKHPHEASGGQLQRVAIARALAVGPKLILADEPTSMLDVSVRIDILNLMRDLKEERGLAYLYITHDLASARYFADRTLVLYAGHIVESGPSAEIMGEPVHPYTQLLLSAVPRPDADLSEPLAAKGGAPKLVDPPPGCPFADRCPRVESRCRERLPVLREVAPGRQARCHLV